jgi:TonB family protein
MITRTVGLLMLGLHCAAALSAAAASDTVPAEAILVRLSAFVGGRESGSAPDVGAVYSNQQLADYVTGWDPASDNAELENLFGLRELGEVVRQVAAVPSNGGDIHLTFVTREAAFELAIRVEPLAPDSFVAMIEIAKNGHVLAAPKVSSPLGQRAITSVRNGPEAPFLFIVVEAQRAQTARLSALAVRKAFDPRLYRVDGERIAAPKRLTTGAPMGYPEAAKKNRTEGLVILEMTIDKQGVVRDVEVLKEQPDGLTEAAIDHVRQWKFAPAAINGQPVDVLYTITINFRLPKDEPAAPSPR